MNQIPPSVESRLSNQQHPFYAELVVYVLCQYHTRNRDYEYPLPRFVHLLSVHIDIELVISGHFFRSAKLLRGRVAMRRTWSQDSVVHPPGDPVDLVGLLLALIFLHHFASDRFPAFCCFHISSTDALIRASREFK